MPTKKTSRSRQKTQLQPSFDIFFQLLSDISTVSEAKLFVEDFFTESEKQMFAKRLAILLALKEGNSYEEIRKKYGVSSATISSVAETMSSKGLQLVLQKIETEQWADAWAEKIIKMLGLEK